MKKLISALTLVLLIGLAFWWLLKSPDSSSPIGRLPEKQPATLAITASKTMTQEDAENDALDAAQSAQRERENQEFLAQRQQLYETSIVFYGTVLDTTGRPIPETHVQYMNADPTGDWKWKNLTADQDGSFVIRGVVGRYLDVRVDRLDHYQLPESRRSFTYAGNDRGPDFKPDPANPEIFRLRKKGEAAELVRRSDQVLFNQEEPERSFSFYDHTRRRDQPEYVVIRLVDRGRLNSRGKKVLDLELSVPRGGLQPRVDPFQFTAPTTGYQPSLIAPPAISVNLHDYFVRFENGNYGRFTIAGGSGQYDVESYLNPDRSSNLEYDREKAITFVQTGRMGIDLLYPASDQPLPQTPQPAPVERQRKTLHELRRDPPAAPTPPRG